MIVTDRRPNHIEPVMKRRENMPRFMRRYKCGNKKHFIQCKSFHGFNRNDEMSDMWRIKCAAENPNPICIVSHLVEPSASDILNS
jgi:hypothetical protein